MVNLHSDNISQAVAEGGSYEVIRKRLEEQSERLEQAVVALNQQREEAFGKTVLEVIDRVRVRTENNCTPRDMVRINGQLLFGYNVFIGLKKHTHVSDVFALYSLHENEGQYDAKAEPIAGSFLDDPQFVKQFEELYAYYKNTHLIQLRVVNQKLLAAFQIGEKITDIRVFRWDIGVSGKITYIDDRGERDIELPPAYDFEWHPVSRAEFVMGQHPHVNILDEVFVETVGGDLTIKVENNTEDGEGIYRESVEDANQSLDDADIEYAHVGTLILLKMRPYGESTWRYLVFNTRSHDVKRIDAIGYACVQLPNEQGLLFPGGYYLTTGDSKVFADDMTGLRFKRKWQAPNGEDLLYVFYEPNEGKFALFSYNMIKKELQNPIYGHGYSLYDDGQMIIFRSESNEPSRIHPMQVWQTPYASEEFHASQSTDESALATIGNAELVQGISELYEITKMISEQQPSVAVYEDLIKAIGRSLDGYFWLADDELGDLSAQLKTIADTAELVLDEFEKVAAISEQSGRALVDAKQALKQIQRDIQVSVWDSPAPFVKGLLSLKKHKGHLLSIQSLRYMDQAALDGQMQETDEAISSLGERTVTYLSQDDAMGHYDQVVTRLHDDIGECETTNQLKPLQAELDELSAGLDTLSEVINGLQIDDSLKKTDILQSVSVVYSRINQTKAHAKLTAKQFKSTESVAEFGAQMAVLSQSITHGVSAAEDPDSCDEQLARLLVQLEEIEGLFSDSDEFLDQILTKREELHEVFESKKQTLLEQRQRQAENLQSAARRVLQSIENRAQRFSEQDELNTYLSSDPMVMKVTSLVSGLRELDDAVKADDVEARFKAVKEQAIRSLRDKKDIFEDGGQVIKLGQHKFSVNTQSLGLTILPKNDELMFHLTGTDYYESAKNEALSSLQNYWNQSLPSENQRIYRAEYLAYEMFKRVLSGVGEVTEEALLAWQDDPAALQKWVAKAASERYQDGHEKGIHDHDASLILQSLLPRYQAAPLMVHDARSRALAVLFWQHCENKDAWIGKAHAAHSILSSLKSDAMHQALCAELEQTIAASWQEMGFCFDDFEASQAASYLLGHAISGQSHFPICQQAKDLAKGLRQHLDIQGLKHDFEHQLTALASNPLAQWQFVRYWLQGLLSQGIGSERVIDEAVAHLVLPAEVFETEAELLNCRCGGLLGEHGNIKDRTLSFELDEFMARLGRYEQLELPEFNQFKEIKQSILHERKTKMSLGTFKARPLASFVRNQLINQSYLPIIGDNLAKQMGALGADKRSDLMGLLLLISPPGYGKTTLMEYVANRLGLNFMKINCPSLGHDVKSLDPTKAPNATAAQELDKLNLALAMGNNVMLYLDDIQHTHPEFLQKFISLCDGTRKIEGVWQGRPQTFDLRSKKFCVIMAGNPYTESGEVFTIPDMLANRADVYNLGDILSGQERIFANSYLENSLTSNPVLAPLALRDLNDLYLLIDKAMGKDVQTADLSHDYSGSEINEITTVIKRLIQVRDVILKVNQGYIQSAAMDDRYRTEPPFKLQGSYRNMNKMAEKVVAVMDDAELDAMIDDHYVGEAQLLTTGAEENLLKLKSMRGVLTEDETARWETIKTEFRVRNSVDGDGADGPTKIASQIAALTESMSKAQQLSSSEQTKQAEQWQQAIQSLNKSLQGLNLNVQITNEPVPGLDQSLKALSETLETVFIPVVVAMNKKLDINMEVLESVTQLSDKVKKLAATKNRRTVKKKSTTKK